MKAILWSFTPSWLRSYYFSIITFVNLNYLRMKEAWFLKQQSDFEYSVLMDHLPILRIAGSRVFSRQRGGSKTARLPSLIDRFDVVWDYWESQQVQSRYNFRTTYNILEAWRLIDSWLEHLPYDKMTKDPRNWLVSASAVKRVLDFAREQLDASHNNRTIVFHGDLVMSWAIGRDMKTRNETIRQLQNYFSTIFFEGTDIKVDGVISMPFGAYEGYFRGGTAPFAWGAMLMAKIDNKPKDVLAAWGRFWNFEEWKGIILYPQAAEGGTACIDSRISARAWSITDQAVSAGIELRSFEPNDWWFQLSRYKFLLSPLGIAGASPKTIEALLVLTVPIVPRGPYQVHDDMVHMGFPMVVIDEWTNINATMLAEAWATLSPRLESFRANCLSSNGYWRLITSPDHKCS